MYKYLLYNGSKLYEMYIDIYRFKDYNSQVKLNKYSFYFKQQIRVRET